MFDVIFGIVKAFLGFFKVPFLILLVLFVLFLLSCLFYFLVGLKHGRRIKKGTHKPVKDVSMLKKVFIDVPRAFINDFFDRDPDFFRYQGLVIYTGRQGSGKTIAMVYTIRRMQKEYPLVKVITNLSYKRQNTALNHWKQLITYKNGIYGVVVAIDEIQNWFSSKQSKDFPPEMFEVVTQNRKNRRVILSTTQNFYQAAKDIRCQCSEVHKCLTLLGVLTIVHVVRPTLDSNGDVKEWRHVRFYSFVHDRELRELYDTYKVIESLAKSGFQERKGTANIATTVQINNKK